MNVTIFIVSCRKHFAWLDYCLRSIQKYTSGFGRVVLLVPGADFDLAVNLVHKSPERTPVCILTGDEWPGKGMLWAMCQKIRADEWCPDADCILHVDSDCLFFEPTTPDDFFHCGKPILCFESFESINHKHPEVAKWQAAVQPCCTFPVLYETMRRPELIYRRELYAKLREEMIKATGDQVDDYIRAQQNVFPQTWCEHVNLGNIALQYFRDDYALVDLEHFGWPPQKIVQMWSHAPPNIPQRPWFKGQQIECTPDRFV